MNKLYMVASIVLCAVIGRGGVFPLTEGDISDPENWGTPLPALLELNSGTYYAGKDVTFSEGLSLFENKGKVTIDQAEHPAVTVSIGGLRHPSSTSTYAWNRGMTTVLSAGRYDFLGKNLSVYSGSLDYSVGNLLVLTNGVSVTNVAQVSVHGSTETAGNTLRIADGSDLWANTLRVSWSHGHAGLVEILSGSRFDIATTLLSDDLSDTQARTIFTRNVIKADGNGSALTVAGDATIGNKLSGNTLQVTNQATASAANFYIGKSSSSTGNVVNVCAGGTMTGRTYVGYEGSGNRVVVGPDGMLDVGTTGYPLIGATATAQDNELVVTGPKARMNDDHPALLFGNGSHNRAVFTDHSTNTFDSGFMFSTRYMLSGSYYAGHDNVMEISDGACVKATGDNDYSYVGGRSNVAASNATLVVAHDGRLEAFSLSLVGENARMTVTNASASVTYFALGIWYNDGGAQYAPKGCTLELAGRTPAVTCNYLRMRSDSAIEVKVPAGGFDLSKNTDHALVRSWKMSLTGDVRFKANLDAWLKDPHNSGKRQEYKVIHATDPDGTVSLDDYDSVIAASNQDLPKGCYFYRSGYHLFLSVKKPTGLVLIFR